MLTVQHPYTGGNIFRGCSGHYDTKGESHKDIKFPHKQDEHKHVSGAVLSTKEDNF